MKLAERIISEGWGMLAVALFLALGLILYDWVPALTYPARPLDRLIILPLVAVAEQRDAITDEEVLTMAREEHGDIQVMAIELISFRGLGDKSWGYTSSPRGVPTDWWDYRSALDEGDAVANENGWQQLWLVEAMVTEDGSAYPTGVRERVR